jgi:hypothetical protein
MLPVKNRYHVVSNYRLLHCNTTHNTAAEITVHKLDLNEDKGETVTLSQEIPRYSECHKDNAEANVTQLSCCSCLSDLIRSLSFTSDRTGGIWPRKQGGQMTELPCQSCSKETLDSRASELQHANAKGGPLSCHSVTSLGFLLT